MLNSTFEQFEVTRIIPLHLFGNLDLSFTNASLFMIIGVGVYYLLYITNVKNGLIIPGRWQSLLEIIYETISGMVKDNVGSAGNKYIPFIFTLFVWISFMNIIGIIPYTFTPTAHIIVTMGMSISIYIGCTIIGLINYRSDFFAMFMPAGSPVVFAPFLVIIEFVSSAAKAISLGVRLAANITAGHLLFAILAGFTFKMLVAGGLISVLSIIPMFIVLFITILEMAVAIIQAYVFSLLTTIYINDSEHLH